jgi:phosphatidylserine/phosphatidylglycerophosphate/cardiolipin synthase-like enzyme
VIFAADWARAGGEPAPVAAVPPATGRSQLVASPRDLLPAGVAWDLPRIVALIDGAQHHIRMQALSYRAESKGEPWTELEDPLRRAAARGVRVELLFADWSKRERTIGGLQRLARVPGIEIRLATIPAWSGGFVPFARVIHAKLVVADGRGAWLGTSNFERDYFYGSRNVGMVTDDPTLAARIDAFFETGWASTYAARVDPGATYAPPRIE